MFVSLKFRKGCCWRPSELWPLNIDDVVSAILHLPDKSSTADLLPVKVQKLVSNEFLAELFNRSMSTGQFLLIFKEDDIPSRGRLQLLSTSQLMVHPSCLATIEERLFASAGRRLWSTLGHITATHHCQCSDKN